MLVLVILYPLVVTDMLLITNMKKFGLGWIDYYTIFQTPRTTDNKNSYLPECII